MLIDLTSLVNKYNLKISGVIHIGAHFGQEFNTYKNLNISKIVFFEPVPNTCEILKNNIGDQAIIHQTALGNTEGVILMNIEFANQGQSSSILKPKKHLEQYPHITFDSTIEVPINKLDNFAQSIKDCNFIMMDVQGYELEVLKGSTNSLKDIDFIMTEINRDEVYENCAKVEEIDEFLSKFNFKRVETNWAGGTWGDAFYIKNIF